MFEELHKYSKNKVKYIQLMHFTQNQKQTVGQMQPSCYWLLHINN